MLNKNSVTILLAFHKKIKNLSWRRSPYLEFSLRAPFDRSTWQCRGPRGLRVYSEKSFSKLYWINCIKTPTLDFNKILYTFVFLTDDYEFFQKYQVFKMKVFTIHFFVQEKINNSDICYLKTDDSEISILQKLLMRQ